MVEVSQRKNSFLKDVAIQTQMSTDRCKKKYQTYIYSIIIDKMFLLLIEILTISGSWMKVFSPVQSVNDFDRG